jgi:serine/threonine-protein kinase
VTLYEMLTGRRPFQAETAYSVLNAQLTEAPTPPMQVNPALPTELNNIVLRAMVKSPDGRFQTADEFRAALRNLQAPPKSEPTVSEFAPVPMPAAVPASAMPPPITPSAATASKGHRSLWLGLGAITAIIAMIAAATVLPRMLSTHADQKAPAPVTDNNSPAPSTGGTNGAAGQPTPASTPPNPLTSTAPGTLSPGGTPSDQPAPGQPATAPVGHSQTAPGPKVRAAAAPPVDVPAPPPGPSKQEIAQARERMIQLDAEAESIKSGVQQIRGQQQAQGLDLRGDVLASLNRMNSYMNEADRSLSQNDVQGAQDEMDRAEKEISTLKAFLGR